MNEVITIVGAGIGVVLAVVLILSRKLPFQLIGAVLRPLAVPFKLLRRLAGLGGRGEAGAQISPHAFAATARIFRGTTDTEEALGGDFKHEKGFISTKGLLFRWMGVRVGFMRMPEEMTEDLSKEYYERAQEFLGGRVPIEADPRSLFEDVEGAVVVKMFHESDRGLYFLLNESRKMINANVRKLTVWFSAILSAVLLVNLLYNDGGVLDFASLFAIDDGFPIPAQAFNSLLFGVATTLGGAVLMWALYFTEYAPFQRNNTREMANYLTRYLARINDHYRTAIGKAKSVTVGEERDTKAMAAQAEHWHLVITWLAFRVFFVETYVRNAAFQITRNSSYYLFFVPAIFIAVIALALGVLSSLGVFHPFERIAELGWVFGVLFVLVAVVYVLFLANAMDCLDEIDQGEWISFHTLKLNAMMGEIVGKYAGEVGYWKNRVGGGI